MSSTIIAKTRPEGGLDPNEAKEGETDQGLMSAAEDLISAVHSKDANAVAMALQAAIDICGSYPHDQGAAQEEGV